MNDSEWPVPKEEFHSDPDVPLPAPEYFEVSDFEPVPVDIGQGEHLGELANKRTEEALQRTVDRIQLASGWLTSAAGSIKYLQPEVPKMIIGLGGKLRSGKDTVADYLVEHHGFLKLGMSDDSLHQFVLRQNPWVEIQKPFLKFWTRRTYARYRDVVAARGYVEAKKIPDLRSLLQLTGTEAGRDVVGEDIWTGVILRKALAATQPVVITGIRYPNELEMLRELEATPVWVSRPESPSKALDPRSKVSGPRKGRKAVSVAPAASQHSSEVSLSEHYFDIALENDSDLAHLYRETDRLVTELRELGL